MTRKAIVAGATGLVGRELVQLLLNDSAYNEVTMIVRKATGIQHPKLQEKVMNFDLLEQTDLNVTNADVFCTLGTTIKKAGTQEAFRKVDYTYPLTLGKMAKAQGAKKFLIVSSIGANASSSTFYTRVKGEIEEALRSQQLPALHIFRPSLLLGDRAEFRMGERFAAGASNLLLPLFSGPLRKYRPIQAQAVAKAMVAAAQTEVLGVQIYESDQIAKLSEHCVLFN